MLSGRMIRAQDAVPTFGAFVTVVEDVLHDVGQDASIGDAWIAAFEARTANAAAWHTLRPSRREEERREDAATREVDGAWVVPTLRAWHDYPDADRLDGIMSCGD